MSRITPSWLSGYASIILLVSILLNVAQMLSRTTYGLTLPSMRDSLDLSYSQAGGLTTALGVLNTLAFFVFGILVARYSSRYIIVAASIGGGIAMVLLGSAPNFMMALLMSGVVGLCAGGSTVASVALLTAWFESHHRGAAVGLTAAGGGASYLVVGAIAPWLIGRDLDDGWRHTWYFMAAILLASGVLAAVFLRDRPRSSESTRRSRGFWPAAAYKNPAVWVMTFLGFCSAWCVTSYSTFFGVYLKEEGIDLVVSGRLWMVLGVLGIGGSIFWGAVSDHFGRRTGFLFSFLILGIGCFLFWLTPVLVGFIVSVILVGGTFRASYTIAAASAGDYVSPADAAAAFGLIGAGAGVGGSLSPLLGGYIADASGEVGWVFVMTAAGASAAVVASMLLRRPPATVTVPAQG